MKQSCIEKDAPSMPMYDVSFPYAEYFFTFWWTIISVKKAMPRKIQEGEDCRLSEK